MPVDSPQPPAYRDSPKKRTSVNAERLSLLYAVLLVFAGVFLRVKCDAFFHLTAATPIYTRLLLHVSCVSIPFAFAAAIIYRRRLAQQPNSSPGLALIGSIMIVALIVFISYLCTVLSAVLILH
jgi:hypothetical protein